jgi:60 kDa SS-A/Ro ribonucleoprotein
MASKKLFGGKSTQISKVSAPTTINKAGGKAFSLSSENALAQLAVTGTFNNTYYVSGEDQLQKIKSLATECSDEFLVKCAIYAHNSANMKDTPALLLAIVASRGNTSLVEKVFPKVITNQKMLRNFVQIMRSGETGRKSFGTVLKRTIQKWLASQKADNLFRSAVGNSPSLADVVKMVHPHPESSEKAAFYGWLLNKKYDADALPAQVALFEKFKKGDYSEIPQCDFRMLTPFLNQETWTKVALNMPWNALRMNINTFARQGVFNDANAVTEINRKLQDREAIRKSNAFPYQILTTSKAIRGTAPAGIYLALEQAMEYATENVPELSNTRGIAVCVDTSGSMQNPVTGYNGSVTTDTRCVDVAALIASCVLRKNPNKTLIVPFDTRVHPASFNPNDSVLQNAGKLARFGGGGTDCAVAMRFLNESNWGGDTVIYVSDNESWYGQNRYFRSTGLVEEFAKFKKNNSRAKLVCIDLTPNTTTQVPTLPQEVLNVGGWSDTCFQVVMDFINNDNNGNFADIIKNSVTI